MYKVQMVFSEEKCKIDIADSAADWNSYFPATLSIVEILIISKLLPIIVLYVDNWIKLAQRQFYIMDCIVTLSTFTISMVFTFPGTQ